MLKTIDKLSNIIFTIYFYKVININILAIVCLHTLISAGIQLLNRLFTLVEEILGNFNVKVYVSSLKVGDWY
jgi:hypothetical protein